MINDKINGMSEPPPPKEPVMSVKGLLTVIFGPEQAELIMPGPAGPMQLIQAIMGGPTAPPSGPPMAPPAPQPAAPEAMPPGPVPPMMGGQ